MENNPLWASDPTGEVALVDDLAIAGAAAALTCAAAKPCREAIGNAMVTTAKAINYMADQIILMAKDSAKRKAQYQEYKTFQQQGYERDPNDPCKTLKNRIDFMKKLVAMRQAWDLAWPHPKYPGGRHASLNKEDEIVIKSLENQLKAMCPNDC